MSQTGIDPGRWDALATRVDLEAEVAAPREGRSHPRPRRGFRPSTVTDLVVLRALVERDARLAAGASPGDYHGIMLEAGCPFMVAERGLRRAHGRGLVEFGASLRTGWPTAEGRLLLEAADDADQAGS